MSNWRRGIREQWERCSLVRKSVTQILDFFHREGKKEKEVEEKVVKKEERTEIGEGSKEGKARERES